MKHEDRTPTQIEKDIEADRNALASTLDALTDRVSLDSWLTDMSGALQSNGSELATKLRRSAQDNPAALIAAGAGIALVAFGASRLLQGSSDSSTETASEAPTDLLRFDDDGNALYRGAGTDAAESVMGEPLTPEFDARVSRAVKANHEAAALRSQDPWNTLGDSEAGSDESTESIRNRVTAKASTLRASVQDGLHDMSQEAQSRIMRLRLQAAEAQRQIESKSADLSKTAASSFQKHPLAYGAGALAIGAAAATLLPRSTDETRQIAEMRDRLMAEARRTYDDERRKVEAAARAAVAEGKKQVRAAAHAALDGTPGAAPKAKDSAKKMRSAAKAAYGATPENGSSTGAKGDPLAPKAS
ncbi:DUF3618 domain-containing protein (plasmid) [Rhodobacteraceae bacterium SC52]|nr:DUF3618 domain-containing protein [Rhodobacteraceae bacterium SC52]